MEKADMIKNIFIRFPKKFLDDLTEWRRSKSSNGYDMSYAHEAVKTLNADDLIWVSRMYGPEIVCFKKHRVGDYTSITTRYNVIDIVADDGPNTIYSHQFIKKVTVEELSDIRHALMKKMEFYENPNNRP